ncbi:hypothetical protein [Burkholderia lata]|uniref:hypothetical protein n=1 Tax=Burkholderia lata (strain ATCC 17760 / DSM 23089 / LMG 22485 / NCIMB 9086 / R18194 / 383) TaxID=482957 RepID=UPI001581F85D|nr:hypothetical protein [Burkholderia lata]
MIPAKAHSPSSRIIHSALFCRPALFRQRWSNPFTVPQRLAGRTVSVLFPGTFFRVAQYECVIFSEMSALPFSFPGNGLDDYKSKLK